MSFSVGGYSPIQDYKPKASSLKFSGRGLDYATDFCKMVFDQKSELPSGDIITKIKVETTKLGDPIASPEDIRKMLADTGRPSTPLTLRGYVDRLGNRVMPDEYYKTNEYYRAKPSSRSSRSVSPKTPTGSVSSSSEAAAQPLGIQSEGNASSSSLVSLHNGFEVGRKNDEDSRYFVRNKNNKASEAKLGKKVVEEMKKLIKAPGNMGYSYGSLKQYLDKSSSGITRDHLVIRNPNKYGPPHVLAPKK